MKLRFLVALSIAVLCLVNGPQAALPQAKPTVGRITTPKEHLGFNLGDDYCLANYKQLMSYWAKLEKESDRLKVVPIGTTEWGRTQVMGIVTSPANHKKLDYFKQIAHKLARAEGVSAEEASKLAVEGKAVVWIDGGLHASESLCAQALMETLYQYVAATDAESLRILDDVIILFVQANPDGMDQISDNYMKNKGKGGGGKGGGGGGGLYEKYAGHDNNRDFYANVLAETKNMNKVMNCEWFPQIVYNHHQTGPAGTIVFIPPNSDPYHPSIHPLVIGGIEAVGTNMMMRYIAENKPGAVTRSSFNLPAWFNGDLSTTPQFHNMIGMYSETVGGPAPMTTPFMPKKLLPNSDYLLPLPPQEWHFRQSLDYSVSGNKSILDYASRNREHLLKNIWIMGKDSIDAGNRDSWTITPTIVAKAAAATGGGGGKGGGGKGGGGGFGKGGGNAVKDYERLIHDPALRDPRGYILPANQPDFPTATKFINTLLGNGCIVHRATADFEVAGKKYPQGSYVVKSAQAFRPHVLVMFEPQDHPKDYSAPQDQAGWTLAYMMGVQFDRILEGFDGPFEEIKAFEIPPPPAKVQAAKGMAVGYFLSRTMNDSFRAVNQLHKAGQEVWRLQEPATVQGEKYPAGTFFITAKPNTLAVLEKIAAEVGTPFTASTEAPGKEAVAVKAPRIGLLDSGNSMPAGWVRWILEKYDFPYKTVNNATLSDPKLIEKFDVLLFIEGGGGKGGGGGGGGDEENSKNLKKFVEEGGTIIATGGSTSMGKTFGLPLSNVSRGGSSIHHSIVRMKVNTETPLTWGMEEYTDVMFANSPIFKLGADAENSGMVKLGWFDTKTPLRSGLAIGSQAWMEGGVTMIDAKIGKGRLALFGPQVTFRAQQYGTFKLVFNGIMQSGIKQ